MDITMNETAREELLTAIKGISENDFNQARGGANDWTLKQTAEHVYFMEKAVANMVLEAIDSSEEVTNDASTSMEEVSAQLFPTEVTATVDEIIAKLSTSQDKLREAVEQLDGEDGSKRVSLHPSIGKMSLDEWISFLSIHEINHVSEINGIKSNYNI